MAKQSRGRNHFKSEWLKLKDANGDEYGTYIIKTGEFSAKCKMCSMEFSIGNMGLSQLNRHSKTKKHVNVADLRLRRVPGQAVLALPGHDPGAETEEDVDDPAQINESGSESPAPSVTVTQAQTQSNRGILNFFTFSPQRQASLANNNNSPCSTPPPVPVDKVAKAEILFILHGVNKNYSFMSLEDLEPVIKASFTDSKTAQKICLGRKKVSYAVSEALGPHFLNETLKDIKESEAFGIGLDTATTRHQGLKKGMDLKIRYFSEAHQRVVDSYIDTKNLGHETGEIMKDTCVKMLKDAGLELHKIFVVSRDNPNVMRTFNRLLENAAAEEGNLKMFQAPCTLHPLHTGFKQAVEALGMNVDLFLVDIHGWWKLSTARREDMIELRNELEESNDDEFFLRHVQSRWLTMAPVSERILKHWKDLTEYFAVFLPSSDEKSHKDGVKSDRYQRIIKVLKPAENDVSQARIKFVVFLSSKTEMFLKMYQSEKPLAFRLYTDICLLVTSLLNCVMKEEHIPKECDGKQFREIDTSNSRLFKDSRDCDFGPVVKAAIRKCSDNVRSSLRKEFKAAMLKMIHYLITRLPFDDRFLQSLSWADPRLIDNEDVTPKLVSVARQTKRFSDNELNNLNNQLGMVKLSSGIPAFDQNIDSFEGFWLNKVLKKVESDVGAGSDQFKESKKLIKLISIYPNSQGWIERGFNDTKRMAESRQSISENVMRYSKVLLDVVRAAGGPDKLYITHELVGAHQSASSTYKARLFREKREREQLEAEKKRNEAKQERKRKHDEEMSSWESKMKKSRADIDLVKKSITKLEGDQKKAFEQAERFKSSHQKEASYKLAKIAMQSISDLRSELDLKQEKFNKLISKKPKFDK